MTITTEIKNAIVNEMAEELDNREYDFETCHLKTIVSECLNEKRNLIEVLSKHPNWNPEKLMIQFDTDIERRINTDEIYNFTYWIARTLNIDKHPWHSKRTREAEILCFIDRIKEQFFNEFMKNDIDNVNALNENFKLRTNMKASKAIGKICREEGWDKLEGYNKKYAALCDALNPLKVKRHTVISVNPVDYLLMSNGNSWESCHYIGGWKGDSGCYSSGTISYMLDPHSFVFYTVDASYDGNEIERAPKMQRQIFGYNDEVLVQLRLYPQSNDCGAEAVYDDIRAIVQKVIADCLGKSNLWIKSKNDIRDVVEHGYGATCYPDWKPGCPGAEHCCVSTLKERVNGKENRHIIFGAEPICIHCGERHRYEENIECDDCYNGNYYTCADCGERISEEDVYWYEDQPYCGNCVTYCDECGEYVPNDQVHYIDGLDVCDDCIKDRDYYQCSECGEIHYIDNLYYDEETGCDYCEYCYNELMKEREAGKREAEKLESVC